MNKKCILIPFIPIMFSLNSCSSITPEELNIIGPEFICINKDFNFKIESNPINAKKDVVWSVDNDKVASIDQNGLFHPISKGEVNIKIKSKVNEKLESSLKIKVYDSLNTNDEFLNNYEKIYTILKTKSSCDASVLSSDFTIQTSGKISSFYDIKFLQEDTPKFHCKYKEYNEEKEYHVPILTKENVKKNFDSIEQYKKTTGKNADLLCKINEDGTSSYYSYLENNNSKLYEYKTFDQEGYLIRYKQVLGDNENLQTLDDFHITYTK